MTGFDTYIAAQVFDASGTALGGPIAINTTTASAQDDATIAGMADGGFVIARTDSGAFNGFTFAFDIGAQAFHADGSLNEAEVLSTPSLTASSGKLLSRALPMAGLWCRGQI